MPTIQTVTGPVLAESLGLVLVHEHVAASSPDIMHGWPELYGGRERLVELAVRVLKQAHGDGVRTIVDATPIDLGRDVRLLADVSRRSGVTIIAATGHWLNPSVAMTARTTEELAGRFIADATEGLDGSTIRAGVLKIASDAEITPFQERVLRAAAQAHHETGVPIITHTAAHHRTGEKQAALFEELGVDPGHVVIGHSDDSTEIDYLAGLAERGYLIGMDRLPNGNLPEYGSQTVSARVRMIADLVELGHGGQLVLSHDDPIWAGVLSAVDQARHQESNPHGLSFISRVVLPALRAEGVPEAAITSMTVDNPRRWLANGA